MKDAALMTLNLTGGLFGWGNFYQQGALQEFSPETHAEWVKEFQASVVHGEHIDLPNADGFTAYTQTRIADIEGFSKVRAPDGSNLNDKLKADTDAAKAVKKAIVDALRLAEKTRTAKKEYEDEISMAVKAVTDPRDKFSLRSKHNSFHLIHADALAAIETQHADEMKALEAIFTSEEANLKTIGFAAPPQIDKLKKDMVETLKASQQKELDAFKKTIEEPLKKMDKSLVSDTYRVSWLMTLEKKLPAVKQAIDILYNENRKKEGEGITLSLGKSGTHRARYKGIKPEDLQRVLGTIETVTGNTLKKEASGAFRLEFPHHWLSPFYYHSSHNKMKADMLVLVGAIKASGYGSITLDISNSNPKRALELAQLAYIACREYNFDPKKITININGEKKSAEEIFKTAPALKQDADNRAEGRKRKFEDALQLDPEKDPETQRFRKALKTGQTTNPNAPEPPEDTTPKPTF